MSLAAITTKASEDELISGPEKDEIPASETSGVLHPTVSRLHSVFWHWALLCYQSSPTTSYHNRGYRGGVLFYGQEKENEVPIWGNAGMLHLADSRATASF